MNKINFDPTNAERQKNMRARRNERGLVRREYWATPEEHEQLKALHEQITSQDN